MIICQQKLEPRRNQQVIVNEQSDYNTVSRWWSITKLNTAAPQYLDCNPSNN